MLFLELCPESTSGYNLHIYPLCGVVYFPWQIEGTDSVSSERHQLAKWSEGNYQSYVAKFHQQDSNPGTPGRQSCILPSWPLHSPRHRDQLVIYVFVISLTFNHLQFAVLCPPWGCIYDDTCKEYILLMLLIHSAEFI